MGYPVTNGIILMLQFIEQSATTSRVEPPSWVGPYKCWTFRGVVISVTRSRSHTADLRCTRGQKEAALHFTTTYALDPIRKLTPNCSVYVWKLEVLQWVGYIAPHFHPISSDFRDDTIRFTLRCPTIRPSYSRSSIFLFNAKKTKSSKANASLTLTRNEPTES